jgi:demethylmenaquinone methyltransferase/2-methoxy-6-polyprenyl-1,4-benzoquinol methylase
MSRAGALAPPPDSPNRFAQDLFAGLPPRYDVAAAALSFGQDGRWRRTMVDRVAAARPGRVLDVATGTGAVALDLVARTGAHVTGLDLSPDMLARARERIARLGVADRVELVAGRAEDLPFPDGSFDAVTFTYLLRYVADPAATIRELARVVRPGGMMAGLDFHVPPSLRWRVPWWLYTRVGLPAAGLAFGPAWYRVGRFLGPSICAYHRGHPVGWAIDAWRGAGLADVEASVMSLGGGLVMWGRKP